MNPIRLFFVVVLYVELNSLYYSLSLSIHPSIHPSIYHEPLERNSAKSANDEIARAAGSFHRTLNLFFTRVPTMIQLTRVAKRK